MPHIDLKGTWSLRLSPSSAATLDIPKDFDRSATYPVQVPGDNLSALITAGTVPDPYVGDSELEVQWVGRADWIFERELSVPESLLHEPEVYLAFESLDTIADVFVNGAKAGASDNMFVRRRYAVKKLLRPGRNGIEVHFHSAEAEAMRRAKRLTYPIPHTEYPIQSPHRNLLRKVQCHSGWDWGPCLMVCGIYGAVEIGAGSGVIEYVMPRLSRSGTRWTVLVAVEYRSAVDGLIELAAEVAGAQKRATAEVRKGLNSWELRLNVDSPELWWPAGYGGQPLYELTVTAGEAEVRRRIGFRTVSVRAVDDRLGRSMTVRVNDRDIFCKGANWIPMDALPVRHTAERYEQLLGDVTAANMNMVRVWGGGQYENDAFYEICDRKGILLWHDMMFSCSLYPSDRWFLDSVREEIAHQVKRLMHHASIALWCGNNEDVGAMTWFDVSRNDPGRYLVDYDRLNEGVVGNTIREIDPGRPWWPSSPSAGPDDFTDCWHISGRGDMHFWSVWHEGKPFSAYREVTPR
ncbi:glycoside hydrolase family 2 protein, partial [Salinispira pacifica]